MERGTSVAAAGGDAVAHSPTPFGVAPENRSELQSPRKPKAASVAAVGSLDGAEANLADVGERLDAYWAMMVDRDVDNSSLENSRRSTPQPRLDRVASAHAPQELQKHESVVAAAHRSAQAGSVAVSGGTHSGEAGATGSGSDPDWERKKGSVLEKRYNRVLREAGA